MSTTTGTVYLVGAGPGDPELLTVKARRLLDEADVILHDSLVGDEVVESLPDHATVVHTGKRADGERTSQAEINDTMVRESRTGNDVVRLKGGDPTVFGRGGEEAEYLARHGIRFEIVPGVTSAIAAGEVAGIPATHRNCSSTLTVVTGHEDPTKDDTSLDWEALAANIEAGGTLVILMGVGRLSDNVAALSSHELDTGTPVAMVERATLPDERVVTGTLDTVVERARTADVRPPAVTIVGDVVRVRETVEHCLASSSGSFLASWTSSPLAVDEIESANRGE
ncbi:CobA protein [Haladaptatus sp. R4]|uniref:uroporphyrinogen-III C-methyltransferase n=1 Tax=Haladaptatus sp. R4 TaxID=1679489 RepID=UPI0007B47D6D|nr:uroporphyrinogen-III C-methyltransferase [Haladaptatus sp. R4]KZN25219.1 CobA protein [Haladaptatus sp. R4]